MMGDGGLFDRKCTFKIADAHLAAAANEDVENGEPDWMSEELEIGAHALEGLQIDLWSRADRAPSAACPFRRIDDEPCASLRHAEIVSDVSMTVNTYPAE
jgi:hypothetical protein